MNKTQSQLLELFKSSDTLILDRKRCNFEITAQDLGYLTGYTGVEYSLFEQPKTWVVTRRTGAEFKLSMDIVSSPDIMRYNWVCHTHLGTGLISLLASEDDYAFLRQFRKKRSIICNSDGKCLNFGFADLKRGVYTTMLPQN